MLERRAIRALLQSFGVCVAMASVGCGANSAWAVGTDPVKNCQLQRLGSIGFEIVGDQVLVPVMINDHPARMVLDTSDIATSLLSNAAEVLGLRVRSLPVSAVVHFGNQRVTQIATMSSFSLGSLKFGKSEFFLIPKEASAAVSHDNSVVGILGMDVFAKVDFELDFAKTTINVYSQEHCPGAVVYWTEKYSSARITRGPLGNYYFPMELEGQKVEATISTEEEGNSVTTDVTKRLYGFDEKSKGIETEPDRTGHSISHYRAMALTGPGITISNARIELRGKKSDCLLTTSRARERAAIYEGCMGGEAPLRLGLSVARRLHLYFATKENVLYFSDADASK